MASRSWLIRSILKRLGVFQSGNDLPPEDYAVVDQDLDLYFLELGEKDIFQVPDAQNVPDRAATSLAAWLAAQYLDDFGLVGDERAKIEAKAAEGERTLRYMRAGEPTYVPMRHESF